MISIIILTALLPLPNRTQAAASDIDPTFSGGKVTTDFFGSFNNGFDSVLQPDGKVIVAGMTFIGTINTDFALARYNTNGTLDNSFGSGGKVNTTFPGQQSAINAVALQPDGKIVGVGITYPGTSREFALARYNTDGSLDTTFGSGGTVETDFFGQDDRILAVDIQPDGKLVVAGIVTKQDAFLQNSSDFGLARYNPDGSLDSTFGIGGKVTGDFSSSFPSGRAASGIEVQPDGKIVVVGSVQTDAVSLAASIIRFNSDGSPDNTFGSNGSVLNSSLFGVGAFIAQPDGNLLIGGPGLDGVHFYFTFTLARYSPDGIQDMSFGSGGLARADFGVNSQIHNLAVQSDGRIVAVGEVSVTQNTTLDFGISRFNAEGSPDQSFATGGKLTIDFFGSFDTAFGVVIQTDGKIVVSGHANVGSNGNDFALVRLKGDPAASNFDICLQDESNRYILKINTSTGAYQFSNCSDLILEGTGTITRKGCTVTLQHNSGNRRVLANVNTCQNKATASVRLLSNGTTFTITDKNITNNTCICGS
jgi:uncharacterized delta-60 repeat protein